MGEAFAHTGDKGEHQGRGQRAEQARPPEPPPRGDGEVAYLADEDTGQPDEDEAKGALRQQAQLLPTGGGVVPVRRSQRRVRNALPSTTPRRTRSETTQGVAEALDPGFAG